MSGMKGFSHSCSSSKVKYTDFKGSLKDSAFDDADVSLIWDFYVTHAFSGGSGQEITLESYGWNDKDADLNRLESLLMKSAGVSALCCIRATTIKDTLGACDMSNEMICIEHPRIVLQQKYSISINENEKIKFGGGSGTENRIKCLFRHIRNAFAHGNTYFFENGNVLLEDKDGTKVTARILIPQQALLEWIGIIDRNRNSTGGITHVPPNP